MPTKEILVVKRETLFQGNEFHGFCPISNRDFSNTILSNFEFQEREQMETNQDFQQVIPYVWIVNPQTKQVFAYRRAPDKKYDEARLRDKWSCGLGGHVDKETECQDPITKAMLRELKEEVTMSYIPNPKIIGFLNDDTNDVGKVHFGVVAVVETTEPVKKGDDEMTYGKFYSIEELEQTFANPKNDIETWTQLSWPFVKEYVQFL